MPTAHATRPTTSAPPISASVPAMVTPPDNPRATARKFTIDRGALRASVPSSVPHVSAAAAAKAPAKAAASTGDRVKAYVTAHAAAIPPFAKTCRASRALRLSVSVIAALRFDPKRESAMAGRKKTKRTAAKLQAPAEKIAVPTIAAATAPLPVSERARQAPKATIAASAAAAAIRTRIALPRGLPRYAREQRRAREVPHPLRPAR